MKKKKFLRGKGSRYEEFFIFFCFYYLNPYNVGKQQPFLEVHLVFNIFAHAQFFKKKKKITFSIYSYT